MAISFPSDPWVKALQDRLNNSASYAETARNWEGDILFQLDWPDARRPPTLLYLDLWHGKCRAAYEVSGPHALEPAFRLSAPVANWISVLKGQWEPIQAMMTGKIKVQGNMVMMVKNIPTVLEFLRNCQQVETEFPELKS